MKRKCVRKVLAIVPMFIVGCATTVPVNQLAATEAAIRVAQETGASNTPEAALHLHYAQRERVEAQSLINAGESKRAALALQRAEADANLATALSRRADAAAHAVEPALPTPSTTPASR